MYNRFLFYSSHQLFDKRFYPLYKRVRDSQWFTHKRLRLYQESQLRKMISFAYSYVPYYHQLFDRLNIKIGDIQSMDDLPKIPVLTKTIIKDNWESLKPKNINNIKYYSNYTGGTTGTPLKYRLDHYNRLLGLVLLYRGWGYAGYKLGDKTVFLGGDSIDINQKSIFSKKLHEIGRNVRKLSSFDMSSEEMKGYTKTINSFKPKFIRGYASAIYFYCNWIKNNRISVFKPQVVITTSDKLYDYMRLEIEDTLQCKVFDTYGLNDGGLGAYECFQHKGLHIDTERSFLEVVDNNDIQLKNGKGKVLATSLYNYSLPFIRYETGDLAESYEGKCDCGRGSKILKQVTGRTVDVFITPENKYVHGWYFLYLFWKYGKNIKEYQINQISKNDILIKLVLEPSFDHTVLNTIENHIRLKSQKWKVEFKYMDKIKRTETGKFKFISNDYLTFKNEN